MDFSKHDARTAAENPQPLKLRNPATGEYITDGKDDQGNDKFCTVLVIGSHSRSVQAGILEDARKKLNNVKGKKKKDEASALADVQKTLIEGAARVIRGFENIEKDGKPLDPKNKDDVQWFLDLNFVSVKSLLASEKEQEEEWLGDSFAQQILKASNDASAYLGNE